MDFDRDQFLTDVFEKLVKLPGDPVRQFEHAVQEEIDYMAKVLKGLANKERLNLITMAEQRKANPREPVKTLWRTATDYDRR